MELLVEKVIVSANTTLGPGDALRRVMEAIASGILLPGGPGLMDPCEKEHVDAVGAISNQQREDITASAQVGEIDFLFVAVFLWDVTRCSFYLQHALRLISFRQIHKVLGMAEPLPPFKFFRYTRKRRREGGGGEGNDGASLKTGYEIQKERGI